jgi:hypothetical protein
VCSCGAPQCAVLCSSDSYSTAHCGYHTRAEPSGHEELAEFGRQVGPLVCTDGGRKAFDCYLNQVEKVGEHRTVKHPVLSNNKATWAKVNKLRPICAFLVFLRKLVVSEMQFKSCCFASESARSTLGCPGNDCKLSQNQLFNLCYFTGLKGNGQQELLHALHYAYLQLVPHEFDESCGSFLCKPSEVLPEGGLSPMLPFCLCLSEADSPNKLQEALEDAANGDGRKEKIKIANLAVFATDRTCLHL